MTNSFIPLHITTLNCTPLHHRTSMNNSDILNKKSSIDLPGRSILEELILGIALTALQYGKILPSTLSNTKELNFNIILFSN